MKEKTSITSVPYGFARCFNAQCTQAEKCLRRLAALRDESNYPFISIVNPSCITSNDGGCEHFLVAQKVRVAWGVKRLLDQIPYKDANSIRHQLIAHFGKSAYYRFYREERCLMPEDQVYVRQLLCRKGYTEEPAFERYTDEYNW